MEMPAKRALLCVVLVFFGLILSAGCVFDNVPVRPADDKNTWTEDEDPDSMEFGYGKENEKENETYNTMSGRGFLEIPAENGSVVYARDVYGGEVVDDNPDETGDMDEEYDYAIDGEDAVSEGNPVDAIKDIDDYAVQDNGSTIILDTDTGEIPY